VKALPISTLWLASQLLASAATQEEIWKTYNGGEAAKAAEMGLAGIQAGPENIELRQVTGRALVDSGQFSAALPHLEKVVELDGNKTWQSAWALAFAGYAHYGLGQYAKSQTALADSLKLKATRNVVNFAQRAQALLGFAPVYSNWVTLETEHFRFHFGPDNSNLDTRRFAAARETAFANINGFFQARLPKKIDFFVWRASEDAEKAGLGRLGFARPEFCIVQSAANQTRGHEMTHVICYQALKPAKRTGLINEGIAVYFDQTARDRLGVAKAAAREAGLAAGFLTNMWNGKVIYPVAGAFVQRLHQKGGDGKLKELARDQTFEGARKVYGEDLDKWVREFEQELIGP
jgi:tetratricopeptide (TPR) repeat protein